MPFTKCVNPFNEITKALKLKFNDNIPANKSFIQQCFVKLQIDSIAYHRFHRINIYKINVHIIIISKRVVFRVVNKNKNTIINHFYVTRRKNSINIFKVLEKLLRFLVK